MMNLIGSCIDEKCQLEMHHHGALMHANLLWLSQLRETKKGKLGWKTMRFPLEFWGNASLSEDKTTGLWYSQIHKFLCGKYRKRTFSCCRSSLQQQWQLQLEVWTDPWRASPPSAKGQNSQLLSTQVSWPPLSSPYTLIKQHWMHEVHRICMVGFLLSKHGWGPWDLWLY